MPSKLSFQGRSDPSGMEFKPDRVLPFVARSDILLYCRILYSAQILQDIIFFILSGYSDINSDEESARASGHKDRAD